MSPSITQLKSWNLEHRNEDYMTDKHNKIIQNNGSSLETSILSRCIRKNERTVKANSKSINLKMIKQVFLLLKT